MPCSPSLPWVRSPPQRRSRRRRLSYQPPSSPKLLHQAERVSIGLGFWPIHKRHVVRRIADRRTMLRWRPAATNMNERLVQVEEKVDALSDKVDALSDKFDGLTIHFEKVRDDIQKLGEGYEQGLSAISRQISEMDR